MAFSQWRTVVATISLAAATGAFAVPFKWAAQDDASTMDPHAFNHGMTLTVLSHIYEGLVRRDRDMKIEPSLAVSWSQTTPTT
jgi:peptide/nickel transport system substrate-binding protein